MIAEMSIECALHQRIEMQQVIEETVNLCHVGVVNEQLDLEFSHQLVLHAALHYLPLRHYLYSTDNSASSLDGQNHSAERPPAQLLLYHEVLYPQTPLLLHLAVIETFPTGLGCGQKSGHFFKVKIIGMFSRVRLRAVDLGLCKVDIVFVPVGVS